MGRRASERERWLAWANLWLGTTLGLHGGILLGATVARSFWNNPILGPLFLASELSGALALLLLVFPRGPWAPGSVRALAVLLATLLALLGLYLFGLATSGAAPQVATQALLQGLWVPAFWTLVVGAGVALPLVAALRAVFAQDYPRSLVAASCTLVRAGGLALRVVLVYAGQEGL